MIHVDFKYQGTKLSGFKLQGHAAAAAYGSDIVCSAVSALAITTVNSLEKIVQADLAILQDEKNGGYLEVTVKDIDQQGVQLLLKTLKLGLEDIEHSYSKYLKIEE